MFCDIINDSFLTQMNHAPTRITDKKERAPLLDSAQLIALAKRGNVLSETVAADTCFFKTGICLYRTADLGLEKMLLRVPKLGFSSFFQDFTALSVEM